jgi:hypothetical protein
MERYAAKLLFQFRVVSAGVANKRRTCEEQILVIECECADDALKEAKRLGRKGQFRYKNSADGTVHYEFVGVVDLLHLGVECEANEVWYQIKELLNPMERRSTLVPPEANLNAIAWERRPVRRSTSGRRPRRRPK